MTNPHAENGHQTNHQSNHQPRSGLDAKTVTAADIKKALKRLFEHLDLNGVIFMTQPGTRELTITYSGDADAGVKENAAKSLRLIATMIENHQDFSEATVRVKPSSGLQLETIASAMNFTALHIDQGNTRSDAMSKQRMLGQIQPESRSR